MDKKNKVWNSLEIAKLIVGIAMPISIASFGLITNMTLQESNHNFSLNKIIITKRAEIYEQIGKKLNNIYCYIEEVGEYKDMNPETILKYRRYLNTKMHSHKAFWSPETFDLYLNYMDREAFALWQGEVTDARIKDDPGQKRSLPSWQEDWNNRFTGMESPTHKQSYELVLNSIASDLGINKSR